MGLGFYSPVLVLAVAISMPALEAQVPVLQELEEELEAPAAQVLVEARLKFYGEPVQEAVQAVIRGLEALAEHYPLMGLLEQAAAGAEAVVLKM